MRLTLCRETNFGRSPVGCLGVAGWPCGSPTGTAGDGRERAVRVFQVFFGGLFFSGCAAGGVGVE